MAKPWTTSDARWQVNLPLAVARQTKICVGPTLPSTFSAFFARAVAGFDGLVHRFFAAKSKRHKFINRTAANFVFYTPTVKWHAYASAVNPCCTSPVNVLLRSRGPSDISWKVSQVIVYALNSIFTLGFWGWADIRQKAFNSRQAVFPLAPPKTNRNTATSVIEISWLFAIFAPLLGLLEPLKFWRVRQTVSYRSRGSRLNSMAAARNLKPPPQVAAKNFDFFPPAITLTEPDCLPIFVAAKSLNNSEAAKFLPLHAYGVV